MITYFIKEKLLLILSIPLEGISNLLRWFILLMPSQMVRGLVWFTCFTVIILKIKNEEKLINSIDTLSFILLAIGIFAILKKEFYDLISEMESVGWPGTKIPTKLKSEIESIENQPELEKHLPTLKSTFEKYLTNATTIKEQIIQIEYAIVDLIRSILKKKFGDSISIPVNEKELLNTIKIYKGLNEDVYQIVETYYDYKNLNQSKRLTSTDQTDYGLRVLRILEVVEDNTEPDQSVKFEYKKEFKGKPKGVIATNNKLIVEKKSISFYTSVSLIDDEGAPFPIKNLSLNNFEVKEVIEGKEYNAKLISLKELTSSPIPIRIILAIDISGSMIGKKIEFAKDASFVLLDQLQDYLLDKNIDIKIAILPFQGYSKTDFSFHTINGNIWHNDLEELKSAISGLNPSKTTPLWGAIDICISELSELESFPIIICLSDGANQSKEVNYEDVKERICHNNIPIYTIGYNERDGTPSDYEDFPKLVEIAELSGAGKEKIGSFMQVTPEKLPNIFKDIATNIVTSYGILWEQPKQDFKGNVEAKITIKYDSLLKENIKTTINKTYTRE